MRLGLYRLVRRLGAGGTGEVHEAIDTRDGRRVALKMLFEIDPAGVYRLKREFRRMADVVHKNLVVLHELHCEGERWFFTMELLEGRDLRTALRAAAAAGEANVRGLLRQFALGVHALHDADRIHRDLKPSNVMVTEVGRVVIFDFGLVNELDHRTLFTSSRGLVRGTPGYMAPEQAAGQLATPATDWYAVGAILFEALAGRLPFVGGVMKVLLDKQERDAPRVSDFVAVSPELDALIAALLCRLPSARPGVVEILAWCAEDRALGAWSRRRSVSVGDLEERGAHLEALHEAFAHALAGRPSCVDIVGAAGTGKTALIRQFVAQIGEPSVLVLAGACSVREVMPFRAFDGLVDALAGHLSRLPFDEGSSLAHGIGAGLSALTRIFPVLARVTWIARSVVTDFPGPTETRQRAFSAFKQLLFRLAERISLVLVVDDLQWGDVDSGYLLDALLAPPGIPACLLLCAYRDDAPSSLLSALALGRAVFAPAYALQVLKLRPLSFEATSRLALRLMALTTPEPAPLARRIACEAAGNPGLVHVLVQRCHADAADAEWSVPHVPSAGLLAATRQYPATAVAALTFDHAAELFRLAVSGNPDDREHLEACASALVRAGRGTEAVPLLLAAAERAPGPIAARFRRLSVEQLLVHGHLERGCELLREFIPDAYLPGDAGTLNALLRAHTRRLVRRGFRFTERRDREVSEDELERIDLLWTAGKGLFRSDPLRSAVLLAQSTYFSLEAGEPTRIARNLLLFGLLQSGRGQASTAIFTEAQRLAHHLDDHYAVGFGVVCAGIVAANEGRWLPALADLDFGSRYLHEHCPAATWEHNLGSGSVLAALEALGEFGLLSNRAERMFHQAHALGDGHGVFLATMSSALTALARGDPTNARVRARRMQGAWLCRASLAQGLLSLRLEVYCDLYEGRPEDAWRSVSTVWPMLEDNDILRLREGRSAALMLRAKALLAAARRAPAAHRHLLSVVAQDAAQLAQEGLAHLAAEAAMLRAGLAACAGDECAQAHELAVALAEFEGADMHVGAAIVRRLQTRSPDEVARQDDLLRMRGIGEPTAWSRVVAPGLVG